MPSHPEMEYIATETHGHYHVGVQPESFLQDFLPWNPATSSSFKMKAPTDSRISSLVEAPGFQNEAHIISMLRSQFIKALDGWVITSDNEQLCFSEFKEPDKQCNNLNVDVSTYWQKHLPQRNTFSLHQTQQVFRASHQDDAFCHEHDEPLIARGSGPQISPRHVSKNGTYENDSGNSVGTTDSHMSVPEHEYRSGGEEEIPSTSSKGENRTKRGCATLGEVAAYAGIALSMAFRTHLFSLLIMGRYARFIRWDRRGAVVTHRFDYVLRPHLLFDFYLRYGQLSEAQRGFDTTVSKWIEPLPEAVRNAFNNYPREAWYGGAEFRHISQADKTEGTMDTDEDVFFLVEVMDNVLDRTEAFIVPSPRFHSRYYNPFSRGTRRSLACPIPSPVNPSEPLEMCFIKESWQDLSFRSAPEADIYRLLKQNRVEHVASMRLGGDVEGLITRTQHYSGEHDQADHSHSRNLSAMVCHRLVLETVARDLSTFGWAKVLISCVADAVQASQQAYKAGILHRDISAGNVMITRNKQTGEWRGLLVDWDMSMLLDDAPDFSPGRTGTWAFMSVNLSSRTATVTHTLADDLESYFWVIMYDALRFMRHDMYEKLPALSARFKSIFSHSSDSHGSRASFLSVCSFNASKTVIARFTAPGVNDIIDSVGKVFYNKRYTGLEKTFTHINLDDPDDSWLVDLLRTKAAEMQPLNVTPTGLKSPTNDSLPPANRSDWCCASSADAPFDFRQDRILNSKQRGSIDVALTTRQINYLDGITDMHTSANSSGVEFVSPLSPKRLSSHSTKFQHTSPGYAETHSTSSSIQARSRLEYMKGRSPYLTPSPSSKRRYKERDIPAEQQTSPRSSKKHRISVEHKENDSERLQDSESVHLSTPSHSSSSRRHTPPSKLNFA